MMPSIYVRGGDLMCNMSNTDDIQVGISKITLEEARPLKNRTVPIDDEGHYIVTLDVFHQLHCLVRHPL